MLPLLPYKPVAYSPADILFEVFCDQHGLWCARRIDGKVCGTFRERDVAMRFARRAW